MDLANPIFRDENAAREHLESILWPDGPRCPHCRETVNITLLDGKSHRPGLYQCNACRGAFTVTVGTVLERSKIPLTKWVLGFHLMAASKKGMSAHQLHRMLGITYKSAWFMAHRIREAMKDDSPTPMGGEGKYVEADETYIANKRGIKKGRPGGHDKIAVFGLVERGGRARMVYAEKLDTAKIRELLVTNVQRDTHLRTDEHRAYRTVGKEFASHKRVNHSRFEYARGEVTTNTIEGYFGIFKRGLKGVYQHCSEQHLQRYLNEFDFRYNERKVSDVERAAKALEGATGKRLTYRRPHAA